jgi:hypothetical protein
LDVAREKVDARFDKRGKAKLEVPHETGKQVSLTGDEIAGTEF